LVSCSLLKLPSEGSGRQEAAALLLTPGSDAAAKNTKKYIPTVPAEPEHTSKVITKNNAHKNGME